MIESGETIEKSSRNLQEHFGSKNTKVPLQRESTRILRPYEYKQLYNSIPKKDYRTILDSMLLTGMRYIEMQRFQQHPSWFDGDFIHLPKTAVLKNKRKQKERDIILNPLGKKIITYFIDIETKLPCRQSWKDNLRRWALKGELNPVNINVKTTRKTWCSWLLAVYGTGRLTEICLSMGHDSMNTIRHYLNVGFTSENKQRIREFVEGWI